MNSLKEVIEEVKYIISKIEFGEITTSILINKLNDVVSELKFIDSQTTYE